MEGNINNSCVGAIACQGPTIQFFIWLIVDIN
jgi:hypothetical protein